MTFLPTGNYLVFDRHAPQVAAATAKPFQVVMPEKIEAGHFAFIEYCLNG